MAATHTVDHSAQPRNSSNSSSIESFAFGTPRQGIVTLFGYGIKVHVDRGHLVLEDGIGPERYQARLPRVGHGLRRLVVIGADGMISLAALHWLSDQDAAFVMLDRDGSVLTTTGPVRPSDARLRRAQALAGETGLSLLIARKLIGQKLTGQERVARDKLRDPAIADNIACLRQQSETAESIDAVRLVESRAAAAYWGAWRSLPIIFPTKDLPRVPEHWRTFGTRKSPLTRSPRLAVNPANAMLNYLYALLESESRLAAAALGLDPGLGFLHVDAPNRDSLACDLMEPIRPEVDELVLDWITRGPLKREWFFEQRDGNCRLMGSFAVRLSQTAMTWARTLAPCTEWVARTLWSETSKPKRAFAPATRLTQSHRRETKGSLNVAPSHSKPQLESICRDCGTPVTSGGQRCASCAIGKSREHMIEAARSGRVISHSAEAQISRAETQRRNAIARYAWKPSSLPAWLNKEAYVARIQPLLPGVTRSAIVSALGVSKGYASDIRSGERRPHQRHWPALARLARVSGA